MEENKMIVSYHRVSPTKHDKVEVEKLTEDKNEIKRLMTERIHKTIASSKELCRNAAARDDLRIDKEYVDEYISGKNQEHMLAFQEMMKDARDGKIERIYIRRVNRFGRNLIQSMQAMVDLDKMGITIIAVENGIDTSKPFGKSLMMLFVEFAEQERESWEMARIAGIEKAKALGTKWGKPKIVFSDSDIRSIRRDRLAPVEERRTWDDLAAKYNCSVTTIIRNLKDLGYWDYERRTCK